MKSLRLFLVCMLAAASAAAANSESRMHSPHASFTKHAAHVSAIDFSAQAALNGSMLPLTTDMLLGSAAARINFSDFRGDVERDVRATSAFVRKQAAKARAHDGRLIALAACGLVVLQLRRKHKSLPQRRIAAYG